MGVSSNPSRQTAGFSGNLRILVRTKVNIPDIQNTPLNLAMPFQYKHVLVIGGTSGIGAAMASRLVQEGSKVIVVGRRQERLDEFVREHGEEKTSAVKFDISDRQNMDRFVDGWVVLILKSRLRKLTDLQASQGRTQISIALF